MTVRLDRLERDGSEIFERLRVVDRIDERMKGIESDIAEIKTSTADRRRLSSGEKVAVIGAMAVVFASVIGAIAQLANSGVI